MTLEGGFTLAVIVAMVVVLARELISPVAAVFGAVIVLTLSRVVTAEQAFAGLSNPAVISVAALFIVARGVQVTGGLDALVTRVLGTAAGERRTLLRLVVPVSAISAFMNNTPIVAALAPTVLTWSRARGRQPSRYLMPLSYAAILGGVVTAIGTSTNLVVSGLLIERGLPGFSLFELTPVGLPLAIVGVILIVLLAPRLLPERESPADAVASHPRDYTFRMRVDEEGPLDGVRVREAGLRNLSGVYLASIHRGSREVSPVGPDETLHGGDVLAFVGRVDLVRDLQALEGLSSTEQEHVETLEGDGHEFYEAVVGVESPLVGTNAKSTGFRSRYDAVIVAIHRAGARLEGKIGSEEIEAGDALLLLADESFEDRWRGRRDFLLVTRLDEVHPIHPAKARLVGAVVLAMVLLAGFGVLPILESALAAMVLLVLARVLTVSQARDAADLDVLLIIAGSFGLAAAVENSGLAQAAAELVNLIAGSGGPVVALAAVVIGTMLLTEPLSNSAAAALMLPIGLRVAGELGSDPRGFAVAVAIAASASFLTPIGYQTNTMVYGLGGYRFGDYARLGAPITLSSLIAILVMVPLFWDL